MTSRLLQAGMSLLTISLSLQLFAQQTRAFNQNASRSNHTRLSLTVSPVFSSPVNAKNDTLLFRGQGAGLQMGVDYRVGSLSIGVLTGFGSSAYDKALVQTFLQRSGLNPDETTIQRSRQQQAYILVGPGFTVGRGLELSGHIKGGAFFNNAGNMQLQPKSAQRTSYQIAAADNVVRPGFLSGLQLRYQPDRSQWAVGIGADYMQTTSSVFKTDIRSGGSPNAVLQRAVVKDILAGVSVTYHLQRDRATGMATGKRSHRDAASGLATGRRTYRPSLNTEDTDGTATGSSCGQVIQKTTFADGSVQETTFACAADAAAYQQLLKEESPQLRAQNNNTVRSNRTELKSILAEADTDGDGVYETDVTAEVFDDLVLEAGTRMQDHNSSRSNKSASVADHNSSRSNKTASKAAEITDDNMGGSAEAMQQKAGVSTSRSNIRTRSAITSLGSNLYIAYGTATVNSVVTPVKVVYKTKHDTAKNSVSNIR